MMDDVLMSKVFEDNVAGAELLLNIILKRKDLRAKSLQVQRDIANLKGRAIRMDLYLEDSNEKAYNVEVQRDDSGAVPERARYNSAMIDANALVKNKKWKKLPETYIIIITENDYYGAGRAVYHIDRTIRELHHRQFNDRAHILYVNGAYEGEDDIGLLMHDFRCQRAEDMHYEVLSEKMRYLKESEEGKTIMCKVIDELVQKELREAAAAYEAEIRRWRARAEKAEAEVRRLRASGEKRSSASSMSV